MLKLKTALLCLSLLANAAASRAQEDLSKIYSDAAAQWLDGRPEDASGALKYVVYRSSDQALNAAALRDLAALFAEAGKNGEALAYLSKGEMLSPEDFHIHFEKGWNLLSLEKHQDARASFSKALTLTADRDLASQARFGLAIAEEQLGGPATAIEELRSVYTRYPYLLSPSAQLISANLERLKKRPHAVNFIKEALSYDSRNIQAELDLARLYDESGFQVPAWQTYYTLSDMDPEEPFFIEKEKKLRKYVKGRLDNLLYWARMAWPAHKDPLPQAGAKVRVGLYADKRGVPSLITAFNFICAGEFTLVDTRLGEIATGRPGMQWSVTYDEMNRVYQIRDSMQSAAHTTTNSLRIVPKVPGTVILIKNPELPEAHGVNRGDREVSGELTALVREKGVWLINEARLENLVAPATSRLADSSRLPEQLKAIAVTVRTRLERLSKLLAHESREYHLCDSAHCVAFPGVQAQSGPATAAADATRGETLRAAGGGLAPADTHRACGGVTESGASDGGRPLPRLTPFNLYAHTLAGPTPGLLCLSEDKTVSSDVYWTLLLDPKWIENRVNRIKKVGYITAIIPLGRAHNGKIKALRVEGTAGSAIVEGAEAIAAVLGAGTLRSTLFSIRPVYKGKYPRFFLLRGIGTGDGGGLCLLGAGGLAKARGAKYRDILKHYFPLYKVGKGR